MTFLSSQTMLWNGFGLVFTEQSDVCVCYFNQWADFYHKNKWEKMLTTQTQKGCEPPLFVQ